jgi:hypothetical protein
MHWLRLIWSGLLAVCLLVSGCSGATRPVTGEVTVDGEPLDHATITFVPMEGASGGATTASITAGIFTQDVSVGKHRVEIRAAPRVVARPEGASKPNVINVTPPRYNTESILTADVQPTGKNHLTFQLRSEP